ncbi:CRISPR-associated protein Cas5 [Stenotrophomonas maltophilia]
MVHETTYGETGSADGSDPTPYPIPPPSALVGLIDSPAPFHRSFLCC